MYMLMFAVLHLAVCGLLGAAVFTGRLCAPAAALPLVVFVPVWGPACLLALHAVPRGDAVPLGVDKLRVNEEIYRSFVVPEQSGQDAAPLEDVLLLGGAAVRRDRMMEILNDNPERYLDLLRKASRNEDVEVVHYAATALAELGKESDLRLQRAARRYADEPENPRRLDEYLAVLGDSLQKAMAPEQVQTIRRREYVSLLAKRQLRTPTVQDGAELVRQLMQLQEFEEAETQLDGLLRRWPDREEVWLLRVEYAARRHDGPLLRKTLRQARAGGVWFSAAARQTLAFWRGEAAA